MSKYVRTEDGRIVSLCGIIQESIHVSSGGKVLYIQDRHDPFRLHEIPYVKQADTIAELCDAYVIEWLKGMNPTKVRGCYPDISKDCLSALLETGEWLNVYGAIWTDKGLIYVAKMNEKGEFELL